MKHSKEPWDIGDIFYGKIVIISNKDKKETASVHLTYKDFEETEMANAKRIVDCVNACEGMENPVEEIAELKKKLKELVECSWFISGEFDVATNIAWQEAKKLLEEMR